MHALTKILSASKILDSNIKTVKKGKQLSCRKSVQNTFDFKKFDSAQVVDITFLKNIVLRNKDCYSYTEKRE